METVLLLRSFGDFVIALYHLAATNSNKPCRLIASKHLEPLNQSLFPFLTPAQQSVQFLDLGIQHQLLSGFTNRYFFTKGNLQELKNLRKQIGGLGDLVLEQDKNAWLIRWACKRNFTTVHQAGNIYDSWAKFYQHKTTTKAHSIAYQSALIFPDSRLKRKVIPEKVLVKLEHQLNAAGIKTKRAYFKKGGIGNGYQNFTELVNLIAESEYVISSDSLPAHIAQLLQKPHTIIYANKMNEEWITPYARVHRTAYTFEEILNDKQPTL